MDLNSDLSKSTSSPGDSWLATLSRFSLGSDGLDVGFSVGADSDTGGFVEPPSVAADSIDLVLSVASVAAFSLTAKDNALLESLDCPVLLPASDHGSDTGIDARCSVINGGGSVSGCRPSRVPSPTSSTYS